MIQRRPTRRFRPMLMLVLVAVIALWYAYENCGGRGFFGAGSGGGNPDRTGDPRGPEKSEPTPAKEPDVRPAMGPRRCKLRLDAQGLSRDDQPSTVEEAVTACKQAGGADLTVTGDALTGERRRVLEALERAGVEVFERQPGTPDK